MNLSLRWRILLTVTPLLLLIAGLGVAGTVLLVRLGQRSDAILRENYDSVRAMNHLRRAAREVERATDVEAKKAAWIQVEEQVEFERRNLTILPREAELFADLEAGLARFRRGESVADLDTAAEAIHDLNEQHMRQTSQQTQDTARRSIVGFLIGLGIVALLALGVVWWLMRAILGPIQAVTEAARAIGAGQLHLLVPVYGEDELGQLAHNFNAMTARLREYRQSNTERLLRARTMGQATIDSFPDPVVVLDLLGRVESANPAAQRVLGVRPASETEPPQTWQPPEALQPAVVAAIQHQRATLTETFDESLTFRENGAELQFLPQVRPIRASDGETLGAAIVLNDVTRFRLLDQLKSDWVATVSHELKTPLTSVRLAVHVLLEEIVGPLEPRQTELLIEARDSTERLLRLIEYLLALARLEDDREQLDLQPTDPGSLLRTAADNAASRAEDRRITLTVIEAPGLPRVCVDALRLGQALNNLIDNALTWTEPGGTITLSAEPTPEGAVCLSVRDSGVGIPPEHLPNVFERFFRVPGREQTPGTGLGLAIAREIVLAHGGTIICTSETGRGTTFRIPLPAEVTP